MDDFGAYVLELDLSLGFVSPPWPVIVSEARDLPVRIVFSSPAHRARFLSRSALLSKEGISSMVLFKLSLAAPPSVVGSSLRVSVTAGILTGESGLTLAVLLLLLQLPPAVRSPAIPVLLPLLFLRLGPTWLAIISCSGFASLLSTLHSAASLLDIERGLVFSTTSSLFLLSFTVIDLKKLTTLLRALSIRGSSSIACFVSSCS